MQSLNTSRANLEPTWREGGASDELPKYLFRAQGELFSLLALDNQAARGSIIDYPDGR